MTKLAIILIIVSLLVGGLYYIAYQAPSNPLNKKQIRQLSYGSETFLKPVVFSKINIKSGEEFSPNNLIAEGVPNDSVPQGAISSFTTIVGRRSIHDIPLGQAITHLDLNPAEYSKIDELREQNAQAALHRGFRNVWYPSRGIKEGEVLPIFLIESQERNKYSVPVDSVKTLRELRGRRAKNAIYEGEIIKDRDLNP